MQYKALYVTLFHSIHAALRRPPTLSLSGGNAETPEAKQPNQGHTVNVSVEMECRQMTPGLVLSPDRFKPGFEQGVCSGMRSTREFRATPQCPAGHRAPYFLVSEGKEPSTLSCMVLGLPNNRARQKRCSFQNMFTFNFKKFKTFPGTY